MTQAKEKVKLPELLINYSQAKADLEQYLNTLDELSDPGEQAHLEEYLQNYNSSEQDVEEKLNAWCFVLSELKAQSEYNRLQAKRFSLRAQTLDNRIKVMKQYLLFAVKSLGFNKLKLKDHSITVRKPSKKVVILGYTDELFAHYSKEIAQEDQIDKSALKADLMAGMEVPYAKLEDGDESILIK